MLFHRYLHVSLRGIATPRNLHRLFGPRVSSLESTLTWLPATVDSKGFASLLSLLEATLTIN